MAHSYPPQKPTSITTAQPTPPRSHIRITDIKMTSYGPFKNKMRLTISDVTVDRLKTTRYGPSRPISLEPQAWRIVEPIPMYGSRLIFQIFEISVLSLNFLKARFTVSLEEIFLRCLQNPGPDLVLDLHGEFIPEANLHITIKTAFLSKYTDLLVPAKPALGRLSTSRLGVDELMKKPGHISELHDLGKTALTLFEAVTKQAEQWKVCPKTVFDLFDKIADFTPHLRAVLDVDDNEVKIISKRVLFTIGEALRAVLVVNPKELLDQYEEFNSRSNIQSIAVESSSLVGELRFVVQRSIQAQERKLDNILKWSDKAVAQRERLPKPMA